MKKTTAIRNPLAIAILTMIAISPNAADSKSAKDIFAEVSGSIVVVFVLDANGKKTAQGSGVVVGKNEVATNCHVISGAATIAVRQLTGARGRESYKMQASVAAQNKDRDLCLLSVKDISIPPAPTPLSLTAAHNVSIGEEVYAIGTPQGLELSISRGIVSQLRGDYGKRSAPIIQTDAAISPGSSGGGLFNEDGALIGITTFKFSGAASEGLSFALPVEWVKALVFTAQERGKCYSSPTAKCLLDEAVRIAKEIENPQDTTIHDGIGKTLSTIATAQSEVGNRAGAKTTLAYAIHTTERIDDAEIRTASFLDIGTAQIKIGDNSGARLTLEAATRAVEKAISQAPTKIRIFNLSHTVMNIAAAQAEMGDIVRATQTLKLGRQDQYFKDKGFSIIAIAQTKAGDIAGAIQTTEKIEAVSTHSLALRRMAVAQAEADNIAGAMQAVEKNHIGDQQHGSALNKISAIQAEVGDIARAIQSASRIRDANTRSSLLSKIAVAQAQGGDKLGANTTFTNAIRTAGEIHDTRQYISALTKIAVAQSQGGDKAGAKASFAKAIKLVEEITADIEVSEVWAKAFPFPNTLTEEEKNTLYVELTRDQRTDTLLNIAVAQAEADDLKGAMDTALTLPGIMTTDDDSLKTKRAVALANIAVAITKPE